MAENIKKTISKKIGHALYMFNMIEEGDKILVAVSGGKDSLTMLHNLAHRQKNHPIKYDFEAIHIASDFCSCCSKSKLEDAFKQWNIKYHIVSIPIIARLKPGKKMNCYWCSTQRRIELINFATENGFNKVALGHHLDDIIETYFMNILQKGQLATMLPVMKYKKYNSTIIRPLAFLEEREIIRFTEAVGIKKAVCTCPYGKNSDRKVIREKLAHLTDNRNSVKMNILKSMQNVDYEFMMFPEKS